MLITLRNDFHGTEARVREGLLSARQVRRAWRKLCGMQECRCSGYLGARGPQECDVREMFQSDPKADGQYAVLPIEEAPA